jgi:phage host-nuclease inhibitor protein Gam
MKRKITNVSRVAHQLTDPKPEYVSLVGHGANQTPFRAVKADVADFRGMDLQEEKMTKSKSKTKPVKEQKTDAAFPKAAEVQKVVFNSAQFVDEDAVTQYLEAKGYAEFTVTKTDTGFEVIAKEAEAFTEVKEIVHDDGVVFHVGKLAEGETGLETVEEAATQKSDTPLFKTQKGETSAEIVKRYCDYYDCYKPPEGKTVADVLSEQYADGTFPAMYELNTAFWSALYNLVKDGENEKIKALCAEFGDMIVAILDALKAAGVDVSAVQKFFATPEETMSKEQVAKSDEKDEGGAASTPAPETNTPAAPAEGDAVKDEPKEDVSTEQKAAQTDMVDVIAKAVTAAIAPLQKNMETLQGELASLSKGTSGSLAELGEKISKTGERVDELQSARQTRKSADDQGVASGTQEEEETQEVKTKKAFDERILRNRLGFLSNGK